MRRIGGRRFALVALLVALATGTRADVSEPSGDARIDVRAWLDAYRAADEAGRERLRQRWAAAEGTCATLLRRCHPADRAAVEALLADLWRQGRLSPGDRAAIVRIAVTPRIVERDGGDAVRGHRELVLRAERRFPFPPETWLEWSYDIAVGGRPLRVDPAGGNSCDWEGAGPLDIGSFGGSGHPGTPAAQALIEVREVVAGKVAWRHTWEVGPTRLSPLPPGR